MAVPRVSREKPIIRPDREGNVGRGGERGLTFCFSLLLTLTMSEMIILVLLTSLSSTPCHGQAGAGAGAGAGGGDWLSSRLPKWLFQPLQVINLPLVPPPDLGLPCFSGGEEGVCSTREQCSGARTVAGPCTLFKSVCCLENISCSNNISQPVASFSNPAHLGREDQPLATCTATVNIRPDTCQLR